MVFNFAARRAAQRIATETRTVSFERTASVEDGEGNSSMKPTFSANTQVSTTCSSMDRTPSNAVARSASSLGPAFGEEVNTDDMLMDAVASYRRRIGQASVGSLQAYAEEEEEDEEDDDEVSGPCSEERQRGFFIHQDMLDLWSDNEDDDLLDIELAVTSCDDIDLVMACSKTAAVEDLFSTDLVFAEPAQVSIRRISFPAESSTAGASCACRDEDDNFMRVPCLGGGWAQGHAKVKSFALEVSSEEEEEEQQPEALNVQVGHRSSLAGPASRALLARRRNGSH